MQVSGSLNHESVSTQLRPINKPHQSKQPRDDSNIPHYLSYPSCIDPSSTTLTLRAPNIVHTSELFPSASRASSPRTPSSTTTTTTTSTAPWQGLYHPPRCRLLAVAEIERRTLSCGVGIELSLITSNG